ncbi:hypothetical protein HS096_05915 [candidate division WWE3 bacterium]|uniref:Uncharacterized protein n=1 Tax=candidate division WWE3 bacterium TaxID=2053526 RepID=A0A928TR96_UNCKA|nr:hypothetical protein [candidate division WWE3 bacterium]
MIREGSLEAGRIKLEIAASLDPANSLIRSYLGKAYFEENAIRSPVLNSISPKNAIPKILRRGFTMPFRNKRRTGR